MGEEEYAPGKKLKVHAVIYIPEIMKKLGWSYAFKSQEQWFYGDKNNYPWESEPGLGDFFVGWALGFKRFKEHFEKNINAWKDPKVIDELKKQIPVMVADGHAVMPTKWNKRTAFGTFDVNPVISVQRDHKEVKGGKVMQRVPYFDKYCIKDKVYEESIWNSLDDFFGAIANCNMRFVAKGYMEYMESPLKFLPDSIVVTITDIGVYLRDGFDYVGSQELGFWSMKDKKVSKNPFPLLDEYRLIDNKSYRNYRDDANKGMDFYRYSNIYIYHPNYKFIF